MMPTNGISINEFGTKEAFQPRRSLFFWGVESLYSRRKPLLICAFIFNLTAIICMTAAAMAIGTSSSLASIGWATGSATLLELEECEPTASSVTINMWLGLKGYYGQCHGEINGISHSRSASTPHRGNFCSSYTNITALGLCTPDELHCELITIGDAEHLPYCSACEDTSRDCVGTLATSIAFGIFPLLLTVRRYFAHGSERGLRLRTLFFTSLAIFFGLHAFVRFHLECVTKVPTSFAAEVCSDHCHGGDPFLVDVPMDFVLFRGAKLVIVAACLKLSYFIIHFITPVSREDARQPDEIAGEQSSLVASSKNCRRGSYSM